ncbi:MAG: CpXC domain-containing protein [Clostridia bacterium]|nr:CpXC domain-containing protein [Clostridia bacterium]
MTKSNFISVTCPACCEEGNFKIHPFVDVAEDSSLKEAIFSRDLFRYVCQECGEEILVSYDCTYLDSENGFSVSLVTAGDAPTLSVPGCIVRIVSSINEFVEKIALIEDGIDDRIAELYKLMLEDQFEEERHDAELLAIYYGGQNPEDKSLMFYIITGNAENCRAILSYDTYQAIAKQFDTHPEMAKNSSRINRLWAIETLQNGFSDK